MAAKRKTKAGLGLLLDDEYMNSMEAKIKPRITWYHRHDQAKAAKKETCVICFDDDIDPYLIFSVDKCGHWFCLNCVKQHIEVKLLDGTIPNCLEHGCESQLSIDRCGMLLTGKLRLMWEQRIREDSIPLNDRVYCPNPSCFYLMSKTDLFSFSGSAAFKRFFKCDASFCVYCKVPWHNTLSCTDYKKLHPSPQNVDDAKLKSLAKLKGWRQCSRCQHMVELSSGRNRITCRCGYQFCYACGAGWNRRSHGKCIRFRMGNEFRQELMCDVFLGVLCLYMYKTSLDYLLDYVESIVQQPSFIIALYCSKLI